MTDVELRKLISSWLDDNIDPERFHTLSESLRDSEHARRVYFEAMATHAELCNTADGERYLEQLVAGGAAGPFAPGSPAEPRPTRGAALALALAASLLLAAGAWLVTSGAPWPDAPGRVGVSLAEVRPLDGASRWYVEQSDRDSVASLRPGDVLRVASGEVALRYPNGVTVRLKAPAAYGAVTGTSARLLLGRLTAEVSEEGKGFTVTTPRATVVDLGTEFGLNVEQDGATDVVVFKGEVDVDFRPDGSTSNQAQRLQMGEAVHLDAAGAASRIASIQSGDFSSRVGALDSLPLISEVTDNIERMSSLNFYEIVPGGMREDALAFVDREAHEWNGIDRSGMPAYLVGGDYVKTFNNDKFNHNVRISVRLARPARLYVLFDNRLDPPAWLREGFHDTLDDIGLDVGPFKTKGQWHNKGPAGVGPGESVEDTFSVWTRIVEAPGLVSLGATEAPKSEPNMYGVVAVPLAVPGND